MDNELVLPDWRRIQGYSRYEVSQLGFVRDAVTERLVDPITILYGQKVVHIQADDLRWHDVPVHKLVADRFVDNPEGYSIVKHLDNDPFNNRWDNLEWTESLERYESMPFKKSDLMTPVYCYESDRIYKTVFDAADSFGCSPYEIARLCYSDSGTFDTFYHFCFVKDIYERKD